MSGYHRNKTGESQGKIVKRKGPFRPVFRLPQPRFLPDPPRKSGFPSGGRAAGGCRCHPVPDSGAAFARGRLETAAAARRLRHKAAARPGANAVPDCQAPGRLVCLETDTAQDFPILSSFLHPPSHDSCHWFRPRRFCRHPACVANQTFWLSRQHRP